MYLSNKYTKCYFSIIARSKSRANSKLEAKHQLGYVERHHIIPKSIGGNNDRQNLVWLSAREHYICHRLLTKMVGEKRNIAKMEKAAHLMTVQNKSHKRYSITSRTYEVLKIAAARAMSELTKGIKKHSDLTKSKMSVARLGKPGTPHTEAHKKKMSEFMLAHRAANPIVVSEETKQKLRGRVMSRESIDKAVASRAGYTHSADTKEKISNSQKGKLVTISEETKQKISATLKGRVPTWLKNKPAANRGVDHNTETKAKIAAKAKLREKLECPHCGKHVASCHYVRWHGDNCKVNTI